MLLDQDKSRSSLAMQQHPQMRLAQRLIMSTHMQQAIHLLQIPLPELTTYVEEQIVLNPILELAKDDEENEPINKEPEDQQEIVFDDRDLSILSHLEEEWEEHFNQNDFSPNRSTAEDERLKSYKESLVQSQLSLQDYLLQQARVVFTDEHQLKIAATLIGYLDETGLMTTPIIEISALHNFTESETRAVLKQIQTFDPPGIGATSIASALLIQLQACQQIDTLAYRLVQHHYDAFLHKQWPALCQALKCSKEELVEAIEQLSKLNLHPGTPFAVTNVQMIIPDVHLRQEGEELFVEVDRDYAPSLRLNPRYMRLLRDSATPLETRQFIKRHLFSARWLMRNLYERYSTIERIAQVLARKQKRFFLIPNGKLIPMTMRSVAEELDLHESTIARTVSNKYIDSPRGILPLRYFFTTKYISDAGEELSGKTIQDKIAELISHEDKKHPLSDAFLSALLKQQGIPCARRTVAKHRALLQIGNVHQRRRL